MPDPRDTDGDGVISLTEWLMGALGAVKTGVQGGVQTADRLAMTFMGKPSMPYNQQQLPGAAKRAVGIPPTQQPAQPFNLAALFGMGRKPTPTATPSPVQPSMTPRERFGGAAVPPAIKLPPLVAPKPTSGRAPGVNRVVSRPSKSRGV